jgi:hypothetical protein
VEQLCFSRTGALYFGTDSPAGIGRVSAEGKQDWYERGEMDAEYLVSASPMGRWIGVAERTHTGKGAGTLHLWNGLGKRIWSRPLRGWPTTVRVSHSGARIVVGLERRMTVGQVTRSDRSLQCFSVDGQRIWQKGGPFSDDPLLVAMDDAGEWVLSLGRQFRFYLLGDQGEIRWRESVRAPVQIAVASADGSSVGVAFVRGRLAWFHVPQPPER